jgi:hypothetical protein
MASVIGLAPIRPGLKGRLLELLCIHGHSSAETCSPKASKREGWPAKPPAKP